MSDTYVMSLVIMGLRKCVYRSLRSLEMRLWLVFLGADSTALQAPMVIVSVSLIIKCWVYVDVCLRTSIQRCPESTFFFVLRIASDAQKIA